MTSDIRQKLDQLANFQAEKDVLKIQKQELIDQVLTQEIRARLADIEAEFQPRLEAVDQNIAALEAEIKQEVLVNEASVRGTFLRAVWNKGRVTWDTKRMDDYALYHPEILRFRKQGQPFVSITRVEMKASRALEAEE
jgi:DNA-binding TFAR19-related protein (PDSD5 family)